MSMHTFLFWNLNRQDRQASLVRLVARHSVDVLMLAESSVAPGHTLLALNSERHDAFHFSESIGSGIEVYTRLPSYLVRAVYETRRMSVRHLRAPACLDILVAVVHLPSKQFRSPASQALYSTEIARALGDVEARIGHQRTVLIGDLNMNPFESGVAGAIGLHAVMDRRVAARKTRTIDGVAYPFFYNPMWSRFGDGSPGPPGTYYQARSEPLSFFWNMVDQVLVRPDLLDRFRNEDLEILDGDGQISFLTPHGTPSRAAASDHLPILVRLDL